MPIGNVTIQPSGGGSTIGVIPVSGSGVFFPTVLYRYANLTLPYSPNDPGLTFTYNNSSLAPVVLLYARFFNLLNESSVPLIANVGTTAFAVTGGAAISGGAPATCLDVRSFGAVGDGVTDDTAAIQAALDQAYQNYLGNLKAAGQPTSAPAHLVQSNQGFVANGSSSALVIPLPLAPSISGTLILTFAAFNYGNGPNAPATPQVKDNRNNLYVQDSVAQNGELLMYTYRAPVGTALSTTVTISMPQLQYNSYIAGIFMEWSGILAPAIVDGKNSVVVPVFNFAAPSLPATGHGDLVIYSTALTQAVGSTPVPPADFSFIGSQPTPQPNGLNGAVPIMAVASQNWSGLVGLNTGPGSSEVWTAAGYNGLATMVAYRLVPAIQAPTGKTVVCIPADVRCMVSPLPNFDHALNVGGAFGLPWSSQTNLFQLGQRYQSMAYSLVMSDGVTFEIDGQLIANPNTNADSMSGNQNQFGEQGWALIMNSAWLLNRTLGTQLVQPDFGNYNIPWNSYLAGTAFNEGLRNTGIRITGAGKVYLNGQAQAVLPTDVPVGSGFPNVSLARFYCCDNSSIDSLEILNPLGLTIEWGHSTGAKIDGLYIHDAANSTQLEIGALTSLGNTGMIEMDMLRNSKITNNKIINCPAQLGTIDFAGFQNTISGNTWSNCFGGYQYNDNGGEWPWIFGPPLVSGTYRPVWKGNTYTNVTHNTEITQNTAIGCVGAPSSVQNSPATPPGQANIQLDSGSDGFGFEAGFWYFYLGLGGPPEPLQITGTGFHDNIVGGNTTDIFYGPLMAFKSNTGNGSGGASVAGNALAIALLQQQVQSLLQQQQNAANAAALVFAFADVLVMADAFLLDAPVARIPLNLQDNLLALVESLAMVTPNYVAEHMTMSDAFAMSMPVEIELPLSDRMRWNQGNGLGFDSFTKILA
jgi:hypothetical protein